MTKLSGYASLIALIWLGLDPLMTRPADLDAAIQYKGVQAWVMSHPARVDSRTKYSRKEWQQWIDADHDCQDTRTETLIRDARSVTMSPDGCQVLAGLWIDFYSGTPITNPRDLDIDHVVPLQEAHRSGGDVWTKEQKRTFANDLTNSHPQLRAVIASENREKKDHDPARWLPRANVCTYVVDWVSIKARYGLSMDEQERSKVLEILRECLTHGL